MLSQRYYITEPTNNKNWPSQKFTGYEFEDRIYDLLAQEIDSLLEENVTIYKTASTRDDGKDIILTSEIDLKDIFNLNFYLRNNQEIKIYFECKYSEEYNISYDSVLSKVSKVKDDNIQYYVLITNKTITAYTYFQLVEEFKQHNIEFYLIDQYLLSKIWTKYDNSIENSYYQKLPEKLYAEYQVLTPQNSNESQVFFLLRNYTDQNILFHLHLLSDWNWVSQPHESKNIIEPWKYKIIHIRVLQIYNDGIEDLKFHLDCKSNETIFKVKGIHATLNFEPVLCGKQHKRLICELSTDIIKKKLNGIRYIYGEAGTGKTRLISEVLEKISGKNIISTYITCNNDKQAKYNMLSFLKKQKLIAKFTLEESLDKVFSNMEESNKYIIFILDDVHNLDILLDEIKSIDFSNHSTNLGILLIGRNDYSMGSVQYYNFIEYCHHTFKGEILKNMDNKDTEILICSIIQDIPKIVLNRIIEVSNNNPLYIIQFIEYLLDLNLAHIINRETVGIYNIDNFSNHVYMPDKVENLYTQRHIKLNELEDSIQLLNLLFILSFMEKPLSIEIITQSINVTNYNLNVLLFRKFIKFIDYEEKQIWFYHESLFLYFKTYMRNHSDLFHNILNIILKTDLLLSKLSDFQKGELYFCLGDYTNATDYFHVIMKYCEKIDNYTTCKAELSYLSYLDMVSELYEAKGNVKLIEKCQIYKIYIILHYFTPVRAIEICNNIEKTFFKHTLLKNNNTFKNTVNTLKCHSYVNAGQLRNAESSYQNLISNYILSPESFDEQSAFDMFERLAGLYIRYNDYDVANHYNIISEKFAQNLSNSNLMGLVETTRAKLHFYCNTEISYIHMQNAKNYLTEGGAQRNLLHNDITIAAYQVMYMNLNNKKCKEIKKVVYNYLEISIRNQYPSLIIRCYLLLGVIDLLTAESEYEYKSSLCFVNEGINSSIQYGLPSYIWMLYNLKFIISLYLKKSLDYIGKLAETTYSLIKQQNLLYWGKRDFIYGNIPVITNVVRFYAEHKFESEFYEKIAQISYQNKQSSYDVLNYPKTISNYPDIKELNIEYERVQKRKLLFMGDDISYEVIDQNTGYFIVFA